jgi:ATP-binding cassette, subfamily C (CFTR/MRP), member 1
MFCELSYVEHSKSLAPSLVLNTYLFLSLLFDTVVLRTLWLTPFDIAIRNLFTASFIMKGIILLLEAMGKRKYLSSSDKQCSPKETSGLYSQGLFCWLNSIIVYGFRHILKPDDLYEVDEAMSTEVLDSTFWKAWIKCEFGSRYAH